jgi:glycosyltransferase involved in cell wall biosynthesis
MKVWLVNPFDPLPGEREQLGRYAYLARCLRDAGHEVVWWSSDFSHRFKRKIDAHAVDCAAHDAGIEVQLVPTPPYRRNVSLRRLWNHRVFGRRFARLALREPRPNLILASSPPLEAACSAARLGRAWGVPAIIDIQDQWPDNFAGLFPRSIRPLSRAVLAPYYRLERRAYSLADGIIGVARGYVQRGLAVGGAKAHQGVFPLGVDLADVRVAVAAGATAFGGRWRKPAGQLWLLYSGSLSHSYDVLTIVRAAAGVRQRFGDRVRFIVTGTGELAGAARQLVLAHGLDNVSLTGFLDFAEWACVLWQADAGFNASLPGALIYLPNKIFYYLAAGAAVLNTIPGECAELVSAGGCGLNYTAGDVGSCLDAIRQLVESPDRLEAMKTASRRLAEERFDRRIIYAELVRFLETAARRQP